MMDDDGYAFELGLILGAVFLALTLLILCMIGALFG